MINDQKYQEALKLTYKILEYESNNKIILEYQKTLTEFVQQQGKEYKISHLLIDYLLISFFLFYF